ncbi:MAG: endonuclease domain-containing protein [Chloroflexi bacterium]|nr:endonuclease domain-containing protein [Chloroflexota bacterium]
MKKERDQISFARTLRREQTDAERLLWSRLRRKQLDGFKFRRQQPIGRYVVDFVCFERKLIVELDGGQHDEARQRDEERTAWLNKEGFRVLRFWNNDVFGNLEGVWEVIEGGLNEVTLS